MTSKTTVQHEAVFKKKKTVEKPINLDCSELLHMSVYPLLSSTYKSRIREAIGTGT